MSPPTKWLALLWVFANNTKVIKRLRERNFCKRFFMAIEFNASKRNGITLKRRKEKLIGEAVIFMRYCFAKHFFILYIFGWKQAELKKIFSPFKHL